MSAVAMQKPIPVPAPGSQVHWHLDAPYSFKHVLNIAAGLQSSNPTEGLYIMLQPFGIHRNATNVQIAREQISIGQIDWNFMQGIQQNSQQPRTAPAK